MRDYIDREVAIMKLVNLTNNSDMPEDWHVGLSAGISALYRVPSVDVAESIDIEPKRGEWKRMKFTDCGSPVHKCSICGHYINGDVEVRNFCPNCGAKMK